jgi:hypothetical protein
MCISTKISVDNYANVWYAYYTGEEGMPRRPGPETERAYQVQKIWHSHHEIMRLMLMGWKQKDIARYLNVSEAMVSYTANSELVKRQMAIMQDARDIDAIDVADEIRKLAPICLEKLAEIMKSETTKDALVVDVAQDLLDRAGYSPVKKLAVAEYRHLTGADIEEIKQLARENGITVPMEEDVQDVEYSEVNVGGA